MSWFVTKKLPLEKEVRSNFFPLLVKSSLQSPSEGEKSLKIQLGNGLTIEGNFKSKDSLMVEGGG